MVLDFASLPELFGLDRPLALVFGSEEDVAGYQHVLTSALLDTARGDGRRPRRHDPEQLADSYDQQLVGAAPFGDDLDAQEWTEVRECLVDDLHPDASRTCVTRTTW
ncbi:MAG: hypothetical protein ABIQ18_09975 [Umezawaea sp.]